MRCLLLLLSFLSLAHCDALAQDGGDELTLVVLGNAQDGGYPHIGCTREDCRNLFLRPASGHHVVALGLVDAEAGEQFLFEATPDLPRQTFLLAEEEGAHGGMPDGIFLTHAHWGHYAGLGSLGRESLGADGVPVYAMPQMAEFLRTNGPWSQLVDLNNIDIQPLEEDRTVQAGQRMAVTPIRVPHRDEFSETVGYRIQGPNRTALFIPDIDKWSKWERSLEAEVAAVDIAFLDGTFFDGAELGHRDMAEIPHPFIVESLGLMATWPAAERDKVHFIHLNHTNRLLDPASEATQRVLDAGCHVARFGDRHGL